MSQLRKALLTTINRVGRVIPKKLQRRIVDSPGVLYLFEKLSNNQLEEITTPEGSKLVINPLFHSNLVQSGDLSHYEPEIRKIISQYTEQDMVAYDIGANVGVMTYLFASIVGDKGLVYAFEPEENNHVCLERSLTKYTKSNIILDKRAVGKTKSTAQFDRRGGAFSGRLVDGGQYGTTNNIREVEVVNVDYLIEHEGYQPPNILKIDVEGNEYLVLEGMRNTLDQHSPIIICELHTHLGEVAEQVTSLLSDYGYHISEIELVESLPDQKAKKMAEKYIVAVK
ncbi:FkbM family methyltransferase [Candidatus Albibeggiatoa sp. nov. NOAA]|uniref:FkbM family methyltransferase n=1 Tax=Candidatus Albibeggiatoa sp. nov. NOAA TaxID=3162724 RepID=UPI0032F359E4|nr:FkbM family methyltransferase [Thiotrichaceae bacterium]